MDWVYIYIAGVLLLTPLGGVFDALGLIDSDEGPGLFLIWSLVWPVSLPLTTFHMMGWIAGRLLRKKAD